LNVVHHIPVHIRLNLILKLHWKKCENTIAQHHLESPLSASCLPIKSALAVKAPYLWLQKRVVSSIASPPSITVGNRKHVPTEGYKRLVISVPGAAAIVRQSQLKMKGRVLGSFSFLWCWVKPRALCMLGKCCTTELHPQILVF
jgi:hypothetical protein